MLDSKMLKESFMLSKPTSMQKMLHNYRSLHVVTLVRFHTKISESVMVHKNKSVNSINLHDAML
jgi:hypothetical protein